MVKQYDSVFELPSFECDFSLDIDECVLLLDQCEQVCGNIDGAYTCECNEGYEISDSNYYACQGMVASDVSIHTRCPSTCIKNSQILMNVNPDLIHVSISALTAMVPSLVTVGQDTQSQQIN